MDIDKELDDIFGDPLLGVSAEEAKLFDMPDDMKRIIAKKHKADFVAQRKPCEDFEQYRPMFEQVHRDLAEGKRSLVRISKTSHLTPGHFFFDAGQLLLLQSSDELKRDRSRHMNARTRCIYENGTEANIMMQTLCKNVFANGYAVTETQQETESRFFDNADIREEDRVTGYIYVLRSLTEDAQIQAIPHLYKIGFSTTSVEKRVANAAHEPTYLMAPVEVVGQYKVVNMNSHKFERLLHQVLASANYQITVTDEQGVQHAATEWYQVPLEMIDTIIQKIMDGSIVGYTYNAEEMCMERRVAKHRSKLDLRGLKVLTLNIKKEFFDPIIAGEKKEEYRKVKQTTLNRYTYIDEADGKRYLRRYDVLQLFVGYHKDRESAIVQVLDTTYEDGWVVYHLGRILDVVKRE